MIPHRLTIQDIGPFSDLVDVDLDSLAHGIVAIDGNNGAGKTIFVESIIAAIHRRLPSYGALADLAVSRDAYLQLEFSTRGRRWKARHEIGRGKVFLYNDRGKVLHEKGSPDAFAEWVADNCLPLDVIAASWCIPQESRGFIGMERSDRKSIILQAMGSAESERLAERARKRTRALERDMLEANRAADNEQARFLPVDTAVENLKIAQEKKARADEEAARAAVAHEEARVASETWRRLTVQYQEAVAAHVRANNRLAACRNRLVLLDDRIEEQRSLFARGDEIRAHAAKSEEIQASILAASAIYEERRLAVIAARNEVDAAWRTRSHASHRKMDAKKAIDELDLIIADKPAVQKACDEAIAVAAWVDDLASHIAELDEEIRALTEVAERTAEERITRLRGGLRIVQETTTIEAAHAAAGTTLLVDDRATKESMDVDGKKSERDGLERQRRDAALKLRGLEERGRAIVAITKAERDREKLAADLDSIETEYAAADAAVMAAQGRQQRATEAQSEAAAALDAVHAREHENAPWLAYAAALAQAEAISAELASQRAGLVADLEAAERDAAAYPWPGDDPPAAPACQDSLQLAATHRKAVAAAQEAAASVVRCEEALRLAHESAERLTGLRAREDALCEEVRDTAILAEALGSGGIQALLVDAAGPELTQGMNDLLHGAIGPRLTVSVETTQLDSKGKRELEAFNVMVTDADAPADRRIRESRFHCGGERVYIAETLATTLAGMSGRRFELEGGTLIRDEASAALRGYNVTRWFDLLRLGMRQNGMARALVITHHQKAIDLADQVIEIADGTVRVVR